MNRKLTRHRLCVLKLALLLLLLNVGAIVSCSKSSTSPVPDHDEIEYVTPEEVGYSSEALDEVRAAAEQSGYAAMMALYDGKVFFQWGDISRNFKCHSIRKPFLCALYGIHAARGHINLDETLADLGIDDIPPSLTNEEKLATVRDLLRSRSGVYHEAAAETQEAKELRPERGSHPPGSFYYYNNWDFNALGTIFAQETSTISQPFELKYTDDRPRENKLETLPPSDIDENIIRTGMQNPDAIAVVIGNRVYDKPNVPPVEYATRDASAVKEYLIAQG